MSRDWQKDMETVERFKYFRTLCHGIPMLVHGQTEAPEPVEVALEYWLQQYAAEKERGDNLQEELNDLNYKYEDVSEHSLKRKFELAEQRQRADIAELAYQGLAADCVTRGEYQSLLDKHTAVTKAYRAEKERVDKLGEAIEWVRQMFESEWTYELGVGEVVDEIIIKFDSLNPKEETKPAVLEDINLPGEETE